MQSGYFHVSKVWSERARSLGGSLRRPQGLRGALLISSECVTPSFAVVVTCYPPSKR